MNSYPVPVVPSVVMVPTGTWLYATSALQPDAANVQVTPGREMPYLGQPSTTTRIVAYVNGAGTNTGKAYFVKASEVTAIRAVPGTATDCAPAIANAVAPVKAELVAAKAALTKAQADVQAVIAASVEAVAMARGNEQERIALAEAARIRSI